MLSRTSGIRTTDALSNQNKSMNFKNVLCWQLFWPSLKNTILISLVTILGKIEGFIFSRFFIWSQAALVESWLCYVLVVNFRYLNSLFLSSHCDFLLMVHSSPSTLQPYNLSLMSAKLIGIACLKVTRKPLIIVFCAFFSALNSSLKKNDTMAPPVSLAAHSARGIHCICTILIFLSIILLTLSPPTLAYVFSPHIFLKVILKWPILKSYSLSLHYFLSALWIYSLNTVFSLKPFQLLMISLFLVLITSGSQEASWDKREIWSKNGLGLNFGFLIYCII